MKKKYFISIIVCVTMCLLSFMLHWKPAKAKDICATVKIEILQEMTFERQAFEARMKINNGYESSSLNNIRIDISLVDEEGEEKTDLFFITLTSKTGLSGEPDGSGIISSGNSAEIYWLLIPAKEAAGDTPLGKRYFAGATLGYTIMGEERTIDVAPDMIQVLPQPYLKLDYFLPGQVYGDDPFTEETESAIPFNLGVRIHNTGLGAANKLKIDSGQPKIVENTLGLLVDFKIIGSTVNDQPVTNSLLINFGDLESRHCAIGRWIMISTLTGNFIEFDATLTHADYLGGEMTSLVDYNIGTHFLIHDILIDLSGSDNIRDFLTRDLKIYPSEPSYDAENQEIIQTANDLSSSFTHTGSISAYDLCLEMSGTAFATNPYVYLKKEDLSQGHLQITRVLRSDGKSLPEENYWIDQTSEDNGHTWNYYFHIFDTSLNPIQDLSYCFYYEEIDDTEPPHTIVIISDPKVGEDPVYVNRDTQFTFRADDEASETGTSGIKDMRFALDTEEEGPAPNPFMFSQRMDVDEGPHTLSYRSIDNMGNEEPVNTLSTVLDLTPPLIQDAYVIPQTIIPGAPEGTVVNREALIVLQITDESGLIDVQIDITDGGNFDTPLKRIKKQFPSGGADIVWNGNDNTNHTLSPGVYNLRITASDLLGNVITQEGLSLTIASYLSEGPLPNGLPRMRLYRVAPTEATDPQDQINPDINQDGTIVWQDYRNGNWNIYQFDGLFVTQVTNDTSAQKNPAISGDTIVWQDYRSGDWDIYYKTGTNPENGLILSGDQIYPDISGNRIVFEENGNIYLHIIGGDTEQITSHIRDQILPAIDQDIIVWQDSRYGDPLIYAYDIASQTETQITPVDEENQTQHLSPSVSGDYILWTDNRSGDFNIYLYKLSEGSTQQLTYGPEDQTDPRVNGHHFVYIDRLDIAFGNAISYISERVMVDTFQQKNVSLSGDGPYTLVWQDNRSGHWEIYRGVIEQDDFYIQIYKGLNLVSLPIEKLPSSQNASDLYNTLQAENGIEQLLQYDITGKHYLRIDDTGGEFTIMPKAGYAIYGTKKSILSVPDVQDQATVDLLTGFNQIGLAAIPAGFTAYDLINSLDALNIKMVQKFSSKDQRYMTINITPDGHLIGSNFPIYPGDGLNIVMRRPVSGWRPGRL